MTETKEPSDKTSGTAGRKPLSLQRTVETGHVRQNFSHGRSKSVVVEKKKTRKLGAPTETAAPVAPVVKIETRASVPAPKPVARPDTTRNENLRPSELDARKRALADARVQDQIRAEQAKVDAEVIAAQPVVVETVAASPIEVPATPAAPAAVAVDAAPAAVHAPAVPRRDDAARPSPTSRAGAEPRRDSFGPRARPDTSRPSSFNPAMMPRESGRPKQIDIPMRRAPAVGAPPERPGVEPPKRLEPRTEARGARGPQVADEEETRLVKRGGKLVRQPVKVAADEKRERIKLTINNAFDQQQRERSLASLKRKREREKLKAMGIQQPRDKIVREVVIPEVITIQELSNRMTERAVDLIKFLMKEGAMTSVILCIAPSFIRNLMRSTARSVIRFESSWIVMTSGMTTTRTILSLGCWMPIALSFSRSRLRFKDARERSRCCWSKAL
ncbi:MAG: translation initiation factor IF-2 associated domain-containing protein, partial [Hyphomicrobium sp.]